MSGNGDLFAGLSISSSPPGRKQEAAPRAVSGPAPAMPPAAPPLISSQSAGNASTAAVAAVRAAPVTDKLLGLLGDSPRAASNGHNAAAPHASPGSPRFSPSGNNNNGSSGKKRSSKATVGAHGKQNLDVPELSADQAMDSVLSAFGLDDSKGNLSVPSLSSPESNKKKPVKRISERPPPLEDTNQTENLKRHSLRGVGVVKDDTPIPNSDTALRVLRKFAIKTRPHVPESHGGTQQLSLWTRYVSGTPSDYNTKFDAYQQFISVLGETVVASEDSPRDAVVDSVLGASGDTMQKARQAMATFCHLLSVWSHASAHVEKTEKTTADHQVFCGMIATGYDTATALATHGCLDGVMVGIGPNKDEYHKMVDVLAESVFSSDLSHPATELSVMKFLLSTGCRVSATDGTAMLRA
ncbi:MAG: hypothetical protein SGARI_001603, partial [Bacillariaceae sp.]